MNETPTNWLLLRGLGREQRHWFGFEQRLARDLATRCHCVDLPGTGESRGLPLPGAMSGWAGAVASTLSKTLTAPPSGWGILGMSFGGMLALELCSRYPGFFSHAVVVNASSALSAPWQRLRAHGVLLLLQTLASTDAVQRERRIYELTSSAPARFTAEHALAAARYTRDPAAARKAVLAQLLAAARFRPSRIRQPCLVLGAARDRLVSPSCSATLAARLGASHAEHPTAGHDLPLDDPNWVTWQVKLWLAGATRRS